MGDIHSVHATTAPRRIVWKSRCSSRIPRHAWSHATIKRVKSHAHAARACRPNRAADHASLIRPTALIRRFEPLVIDQNGSPFGRLALVDLVFEIHGRSVDLSLREYSNGSVGSGHLFFGEISFSILQFVCPDDGKPRGNGEQYLAPFMLEARPTVSSGRVGFRPIEANRM